MHPDVNDLRDFDLFAKLPDAELRALAAGLETRSYAAGEPILEAGTDGSSVFVVLAGTVAVVRGTGPTTETVAELGVGDFFGEMALVAKVPRLASVVATDDVTVVELSAAHLAGLAARAPRVEPILLAHYRERLLDTLVALSPVLAALDRDGRRAFIEHSGIGVVEPGTVVVAQGSASSGLHVLLRGRLRVTDDADAPGTDAFPDLLPGDVFGEISLIHGTDATATVTAVERSVVIGLHRRHFDRVVLASPGARDRLLALVEERLARSYDRAAERASRDRLAARVL